MVDDIPGWFTAVDQRVFHLLLAHQESTQQAGDLVELGAYLGKSAVVIGQHRRDGEAFTVCDLFDVAAPDAANQTELDRSYTNLTRARFESNYLSFHEELPRIVQAPTARILAHVQPGSCRFVHIDASHMYEHVRADVWAARAMLRPSGIVVLDDYRAAHTPGVAAAVWEAVLCGGLLPVCVTPHKLYGTWGKPGPLRQALVSWLAEEPGYDADVQEVAGHELVRVVRARQPAKQRQPTPSQPATSEPAPPQPGARATGRHSRQDKPSARRTWPAPRLRKLARDWLPPVLTRAIRRYLHHRS